MLAATSALAAALAPATALPAGGEGEYAELVHERHESFEEMGDAFGTFRDQIRGEAPEDFAALDEAAEVILGYALKIPSWFPDGSGPDDGYETDALAAIWEDKADFERIAEALVPKAEELQSATYGRDMTEITAAFRETGATCKQCHERFRAD
jgi:cytochrome c556